jgi:hypothetical protein
LFNPVPAVQYIPNFMLNATQTETMTTMWTAYNSAFNTLLAQKIAEYPDIISYTLPLNDILIAVGADPQTYPATSSIIDVTDVCAGFDGVGFDA